MSSNKITIETHPEIDENNLHYLNVEISNLEVLTEENETKRKNLSAHSKNDLKNEVGNEKIKCDLKVRELIKINRAMKQNIAFLNQKIKNLEKSNFDNLSQILKLKDFERENNNLIEEINRLKELLNYNDSAFKEFQSLVSVSHNKLNTIEESNLSLEKENFQLKKSIEELKHKLNIALSKDNSYQNQLKEVNELKDNINTFTEQKKNEILELQKNHQREILQKEKLIKDKYKIRENNLKAELLKEINNYNCEIEKIKKANNVLEARNEYLENQMKETENNSKLIINQMNIEIKDKKKFENKINQNKIEYHKKLQEISESKIIIENENKDKKILIESLTLENTKLKMTIDEMAQKLKDINEKYDEKLKISNFFITENKSIIKKYQTIYNDYQVLKENYDKLIIEKHALNTEIKTLKSELNKSNLTIDNIKESYNQTLKTKETTQSDYNYIQLLNKELMEKIRELETESKNEINNLKLLNQQKNEELIRLKENYQNKISIMEIKLDEQMYTKENLEAEMTNYKETLSKIENRSIETSFSKRKESFNTNQPPKKSLLQSYYQNQVIGEFKNLITKMDNSISKKKNRSLVLKSFH